MKTKYTDTLLYYLQGDAPEDEMMNWIAEQTLLDQPDILREFKSLALEMAPDANSTDFIELDAQIAQYEDAILDEKLAEAQVVMAQQKLDKTMNDIDEATKGVRQYVINCIINKEDNADAMKELAFKIMASEKETGMYDENNWSAIL